jgi:very-short-patch-repair endonuclease
VGVDDFLMRSYGRCRIIEMTDLLTKRARELRSAMTDAERVLWRVLRSRQFGVRFRRQAPIGAYIVDFACLERKLVIEVDGGQHAESERDRDRDLWLQDRGFRVLRFWNHEVLTNAAGVASVILEALQGPPP